MRYQIKKGELGRSCGPCGEKGVQIGYWLRNLTVRDHLEDVGVDGKIILNCNEMGWEVVD